MGGPCDSPYAAKNCREDWAKKQAAKKKQAAPAPSAGVPTTPYKQGGADISLQNALRNMRKRNKMLRDL